MEQDWQLATVVSYKVTDPIKPKYEVEDVDVDDATGQRKWVVFVGRLEHHGQVLTGFSTSPRETSDGTSFLLRRVSR